MFNAGDRKPKYPAGIPISNYPLWKWHLAGGLALCVLVFATAGMSARRRTQPARWPVWAAVAISATVSGILLGLAVDKMLYESFGVDGWLRQGFLVATGIASPLLATHALMSERPIPAFLDLLGPAERRTQTLMTTLLGFTLIAVTLVAVETALGLIFDGRWRDFAYAALTMAEVPFAALSQLNTRPSGPRPIAEAVFAGLLAMSAVYIAFNEGFANWQSLWTCAIYLLLGVTLSRARVEKPASEPSELWSMETPGQLR